MSVPTQGEEFSKLIHHLDEAQACCARMSHLRGLQGTNPKDQASAKGWLIISEQIKRMRMEITKIAASKLQ